MQSVSVATPFSLISLAILREYASEIPAHLNVLPLAERQYGAAISGVIAKAYCKGFRDGDAFQGVIARKLSTNPMVVTDWRGHTYFGVVLALENGYLRVPTPTGFCVFRPEYFDLIEITHRRSAKGKKFVPVRDIGQPARAHQATPRVA